jgi:hypothetical protein
MRTMSKWVSMITAGMLLAAAPAFADDAKKPDDAAAAKPDDAAAAKPDATAKKKPKASKKKKPPADAPAADAPAADAPAGVAADVKAGTGIAKREIVGDGDTFTAGTKVWVWTSITGASGKAVKMVWKRDGNQLWDMSFDVSSGRYRTWTRHTVKAGSYTVEVQGDDGAVLGSVAFTVS